MHWNFAIFWINSQPNWTNVWASKTLVLDKTPERVFVGNWANQRFVQNMSKIPPHRFRLLIYFLSYTRNLQLANLQKSKFLLPILKQPDNYHNCCHINHKHNPFSCFKRRFFFYIIYQTCFRSEEHTSELQSPC